MTKAEERLIALIDRVGIVETELGHTSGQLERLRAEIETVRLQYHDLDKQLAVVRERSDRREGDAERRDARRWQVRLAIATALTSILIQVVQYVAPYVLPLFRRLTGGL